MQRLVDPGGGDDHGSRQQRAEAQVQGEEKLKDGPGSSLVTAAQRLGHELGRGNAHGAGNLAQKQRQPEHDADAAQHSRPVGASHEEVEAKGHQAGKDQGNDGQSDVGDHAAPEVLKVHGC